MFEQERTTSSSTTPTTVGQTGTSGPQGVPAGGYASQLRALSPGGGGYASQAASLSPAAQTGMMSQPTVQLQAADDAAAAIPTDEPVYTCLDDQAIIRTPPDYESTDQVIPYGTRVTLVSIDGRNAEVRMPDGRVVWTRRSNLEAVRQEISPDRIDREALEAAAVAVIAMVPSDQRSYAETAVREILDNAARMGVTDAYQTAYLLATAQHESRFGKPLYSRSESLVEDSNPFRQAEDGTWSARNHVSGGTSRGGTRDELELDYWDDAYGHKLGNNQGTADASNYRGRGFVQLTGRVNYRKLSAILNAQNFSYELEGVRYGGTPPGGIPACTETYAGPIDLLQYFDHVNRVPALAARVLVVGAQEGYFTGQDLDDHIDADNHDRDDLTDARAIINGDVSTNGGHIADRALEYAATLTTDNLWSSVFRPAEET